jgi:hypothetical protein
MARALLLLSLLSCNSVVARGGILTPKRSAASVRVKRNVIQVSSENEEDSLVSRFGAGSHVQHYYFAHDMRTLKDFFLLSCISSCYSLNSKNVPFGFCSWWAFI